MNEWGTRCRKTSERRPPVANAVIVLSVLPLICAGMNARMKFGTLRASSYSNYKNSADLAHEEM